MPLDPDSRLGPYRVLAPLGAGGMGEVYRARDEKLERDVAIKVLPDPLAADPDALARFEREAKAVAALSHPNIMAIHDFGEAEGRHYAVMELLDGETLRQALDHGPLTVRKAVSHARQIAEGLAAAHDKGIVHRDLKPENLFVGRDGRVKILDFGLAKQARASAHDTRSPTVPRGTEPGTVMGTAGYMAPEQVRGEAADHRADIFAFGAILYEMLSGRRAFERPTAAETMTAILREDPTPLAELRPDLPPALERVTEHCLEKRPEQRFQSARDLAFGLGADASGSARASAVSEASPRAPLRGRQAGLVAAALGFGLLAGALLDRQLHRTEEAPAVPDVSYLTYSGRDFAPAASPDGSAIAFRSDRKGGARIWVKQLATGTEVPLTDGPFDDLPRFSPDGSQVMFTRTDGMRSSLYRVSLLGGEPRRVIDDARDGAWAPDERRIAFVRSEPAAPGAIAGAALMVAGSDGSAPKMLAHFDTASVGGPAWSPDGREVVINVSAVGGGTASLRVVEVASGTHRSVVDTDASARPWTAFWSGPDRLVYSSGQIAISGQPGPGGRIQSLDLATGARTPLYVSADAVGRLARLGPGRLAFESQTLKQNLLEQAVGEAGSTARRRFSDGRSSDRQPTYSPDGEWILFTSDRSGNMDLWAASTHTGELRQITDDPHDDWDPAFARDGRLLWSSNRTGHFECWTAAADGSGARQLTRDGTDAENPAQSPDGQWLIYGSARPGGEGIWKMRMDGSKAALLVPGNNGIPELSPDGRYVLYVAFRGGNFSQAAVEVVRFSDGKPAPFEIPVERFGPTSVSLGRARWLPDGSGIAFVGQDPDGHVGIFSQDFAPGRDTRATRRRLAGFDLAGESESFGLSPEGRRIVVASRELTSSIVLLQGLRGLGTP